MCQNSISSDDPIREANPAIIRISVYFMMEQKQFKQPNIRREATEIGKASSQEVLHLFSEGASQDQPDSIQSLTPEQNQSKESNSEEKRSSVHERLRVPVSYDDDILRENPKEEDTT